MFPSFPVSCGINSDALCSGSSDPSLSRAAWAERDREALCYWAALRHSHTSDMETKACRPWAGRGLLYLALRRSLAEPCVWPQSASLFSAVWEREHFLFTGGRSEMLRETTFMGKTTCWKWYTTIAIWTLLPLVHPSCDHVAVESSHGLCFFGGLFATVAGC